MRKIKGGVMGTADIARGQTIPGMQKAEHCELYASAGRRIEKAEQLSRVVSAHFAQRIVHRFARTQQGLRDRHGSRNPAAVSDSSPYCMW